MKINLLIFNCFIFINPLCSQNDTMTFNYRSDGHMRTYYSELIIRQDSSYNFTYFLELGYENSEMGVYEIKNKKLILHPEQSNITRTFEIISQRKPDVNLFKSKDESFLGYNFHLLGEELNLDLYRRIEVGYNLEKYGKKYYWYTINEDSETFVRYLTDEEKLEYIKKLKIEHK